MAKQPTARSVTVLVRYEIKQDYAPKGLHKGDVVLYVRNGEGKCYYTTLRRNKAHSCSCRGNAEFSKRCYHIDQMVQVENARYAACKVAQMPAQPIASKIVDIRERLNAPLNGGRAFGILKIS
jgi:hypothetical protein